MAEHIFSKVEIDNILKPTIGKTLGQVDKNNVFNRTITNLKITGIAGDVIEQSVFNYPVDTKSEPDLLVDGRPVELKTTGLKRVSSRDKSGHKLEAKEPMSITAVSLKQIANQNNFYDSQLWHKLEEMLLIYYLYDSSKTVPAAEYANFPIQGYHFYQFNKEDQKIIENDWKIVRDFVANVWQNNLDTEVEFPKISKLRSQMAYLDTAPKYPHNPRFRLTRAVVTTIARSYLGEHFEPLLPQVDFSSFQELDNILSNLASKYKGMTISEIATELDIILPISKNGKVTKQASSMVIARMFSETASSLDDIELFNKFSICYKTITLTRQGKRTEDTKFLKVDFTEWTDKEIDFESSFIYSFFAEQKFLFAIFEEQKAKDFYENNIFLGFKRMSFDDDFLITEVQKTWERVRELVNGRQLTNEKLYKKDGSPKINKTGVQQEAPNLPKSESYAVFLRGTGSDSTKKPLTINNVKMYYQNFWLKGSYLVDLLSKVNYL
ncbi:MutH/Sau3AI family endonuclease [Streptococcus canis]|uniref:MutH/Sau3AI family endonuclease n=1 Tax=Streptococcus canis TaxID=1329 RepID=UPI00294A5CEB|nr:MutH/Sau3AI family endonuclease [Streptococcus canis]MDV5973936.1 restriction endonuclease [Streptococcus canis]